MEQNQRFRVYRFVALKLFGFNTFEHYECPDISSYMLINKNSNKDTDKKFALIKEMFKARGF